MDCREARESSELWSGVRYFRTGMQIRWYGPPDPEVRGAGIKVKVERDARSANLDRNNVFEASNEVRMCLIDVICHEVHVHLL